MTTATGPPPPEGSHGASAKGKGKAPATFEEHRGNQYDQEASVSSLAARKPESSDSPSVQSELERFRLQWQRDLQQRRHEAGSQQRRASSDAHRDEALGSRLGSRDVNQNDAATGDSSARGTRDDALPSVDAGIAQLTSQMENCFSDNVRMYAEAVLQERAHDLDQALELYRNSFRADADVDRTFRNAALLLQDPQVQEYLSKHDRLFKAAAKIAEATEGLETMPRLKPIQKAQSGAARAPRPAPAPAPVEPASDSPTRSEAISRHKGEAAGEAANQENAPSTGAGHADNSVQQLLDNARKLRLRLLSEAPQSKAAAKELTGLGDTESFLAADKEAPCAINRLPNELVLLILRHLISMPHGRTSSMRPSHSHAPAHEPEHDAETQHDAATGRPPRLRKKDREALDDPRRRAIPPEAQGMDFASLEHLGRVSWRFRALTLDPDLWRRLVEHVYRAPQLLPDLQIDVWRKQIAPRWRDTFIHQPRIRLNGLYIASCQYTRSGVDEENIWVKVIHVIEFYRYLRFLPDGRCLSLRTTDPPGDVVRKVEPTLRMKGFAIGSWQLYPDGLHDDLECDRPPGPKVEITHLYDETMPSIRFRLILLLRNGGPIGRWNKMDLLDFRSINLRTGEDEPLSQKHSKPFFFSAVRSYAT